MFQTKDIEITVIDDNNVNITRASTFTGNVNTMTIPLGNSAFNKGWRQYLYGKNIQDAFPMLNAEYREFILTGCTPTEWNAMFPEEEK